MPPQLVTLIQQLQSLTSSIAAIVLAGGSTGTPTAAPVNVQTAYTALQAASAQLATDIAAATYVQATVSADLTAIQIALTALNNAVVSPSNP